MIGEANWGKSPAIDCARRSPTINRPSSTPPLRLPSPSLPFPQRQTASTSSRCSRCSLSSSSSPQRTPTAASTSTCTTPPARPASPTRGWTSLARSATCRSPARRPSPTCPTRGASTCLARRTTLRSSASRLTRPLASDRVSLAAASLPVLRVAPMPEAHLPPSFGRPRRPLRSLRDPRRLSSAAARAGLQHGARDEPLPERGEDRTSPRGWLDALRAQSS